MDNPTNELIDALVRLAIVLMPILGTILLAFLTPYVNALRNKAKASLGESQVYLLEQFAHNFILAAAQTAGLGTNAERKEYAFRLLREAADTYNIPLSDAQLDALIESAFRSLKNGGKVT